MRLDTGAPAGLPGSYPQVFQASKLIPGLVKNLSHRSPGSAGQKPVGHRYSQVNALFTGTQRYPEVYLQIISDSLFSPIRSQKTGTRQDQDSKRLDL